MTIFLIWRPLIEIVTSYSVIVLSGLVKSTVILLAVVFENCSPGAIGLSVVYKKAG